MVPELPSGPIWLHWKSGLVVRCSVAFKLFLTRTSRRTSSSVELTLAWWQKGWRDISQLWTKEKSTCFRHKNNKPQLRRFLWQKLWEKNMRRNEIHCCAMFLCFTLVAQRTICPLSSFTSAAYLSVSIFWTFNIQCVDGHYFVLHIPNMILPLSSIFCSRDNFWECELNILLMECILCF